MNVFMCYEFPTISALIDRCSGTEIVAQS